MASMAVDCVCDDKLALISREEEEEVCLCVVLYICLCLVSVSASNRSPPLQQLTVVFPIPTFHKFQDFYFFSG